MIVVWVLLGWVFGLALSTGAFLAFKYLRRDPEE